MLHDFSSLQNKGSSPLYQAAARGHEAVVKVLLDSGSNVNQADLEGTPPLYIAAERGHEAVVKVLLSNGADENQANNEGKKTFDVAKTQKIKDILYAHMKKKLQEEQQPVDESLWFQAAQQGDLALIQQGINDKIDVNCRDSESRTAVWWAAEKGHLQLVEYLITQHADLSIANVSAYEVFLSTPTPLSTNEVFLSTPLIHILTPLTSTLTPLTHTLPKQHLLLPY